MSDLISRNKLKEDLIKFFPTDCLDGIESKTLFNQILHDIDNAPTVLHDNYCMGYQDGVRKVLSERPRGKWIIKPKENSQSAILICNKCNHFVPITIDNNFCPNCGVDMRGKEE